MDDEAIRSAGPKIVRAVDVGRGNVKYIARVDGDRPKPALFPSETHATEDGAGGEGFGAKRRTVQIPLGNLLYEVGPDVHLAADVFNAQMLQHDRYCASPEYLALTLGALHYMQVPHIDLLVVGLPVATFKQKRTVGAVEKMLQGTHKLAKGKTVSVGRVKTLAQPAGALMVYGVRHQRLAEIRRQKSLIIDVGRRTFDWLVTDGMQQVDKRSSSVNRGMFDVAHSIAAGISHATSSNYRDYDAIDRALRSGKKPLIFQKEYDIGRHLALASKIPAQAVAELSHFVGDASDIANIIVVGGGSFFFRKAIQAAFPRHTIEDLEEPLFANVLGFQLAGTELMKAGLPAGADHG